MTLDIRPDNSTSNTKSVRGYKYESTSVLGRDRHNAPKSQTGTQNQSPIVYVIQYIKSTSTLGHGIPSNKYISSYMTFQSARKLREFGEIELPSFFFFQVLYLLRGFN